MVLDMFRLSTEAKVISRLSRTVDGMSMRLLGESLVAS